MANVVTSIEGRHEFEKRLAASWPAGEWCGCHVVLGVSGGADSVAMLRAMSSLKGEFGGRGNLYIAHLNHGLRGNAADEDASWLKALCDRLKLTLEVEKVDVGAIADQQGDGWEAAARTVRFDFLRRVAERLGARFVATAHTANDQVETVLHRILRGTGIEGLAGMPKARPLSASVALVRPMLAAQRCEVIEYLAAIGQDYRTDATNQDCQFTRNRLRHELFAQLRERYNRQVDSALLRLASQAGEAQQLIVDRAGELVRDSVVADSMCARVDCNKLVGQPPVVVREVLKIAWRKVGWPEQSMGFEQWQMLAAIADKAPSPRYGELRATCSLPKEESSHSMINLPGNICARREGAFLVLSKAAQ